MEGRRDVNISTVCTADPDNQALMFGLDSANVNDRGRNQRAGIVYSRSIKTAPIPVATATPENTTTPTLDTTATEEPSEADLLLLKSEEEARRVVSKHIPMVPVSISLLFCSRFGLIKSYGTFSMQCVYYLLHQHLNRF